MTMSRFSSTLRAWPETFTKRSSDGDGKVDYKGPSSLGNVDDKGFPTKPQLRAIGPPILAQNKIKHQYRNAEEYFRTHFELNEEDFMYPARKAVQEFLSKADDGRDLNAGRVYKNVRLKTLSYRTLEDRVFHYWVMDFESEDSEYEQPEFGSLLVFVPTKIPWQKERTLPEIDIFVGMVNSGANETGEEYSRIELRSVKDKNYLRKCVFNVIEPEHSFYFNYRCIFNSLRGVYELGAFKYRILEQYILSGSKTTKVGPPAYLSKKTKYTIFGKDITVLKPSEWPEKPLGDLNRPQYKGLMRTLTKEVALIQGPPGTGKTYFAAHLVNVLLHENNIRVWNKDKKHPLQIVCLSNNALDHFLECLVNKFNIENIVRLGTRCQSDVIKPYCLIEKVCRDLASVEKDNDGCVCKVAMNGYRKLVIEEYEEEDSGEDSEEDAEEGRDKDSEEEREKILTEEHCPLNSCAIPSSKCYCWPALKRCLHLIDKIRGQIQHLTKGIVDFKVLQCWGVIDEETAQWFETHENRNAFLNWLGLRDITVNNRNKEWQNSTGLLVGLDELLQRIRDVKATEGESSAIKLKNDWNRIQGIIKKFKIGSRYDFVGDAHYIFSLQPDVTQKIYVKWLDLLLTLLRRNLNDLEKTLYFNFWTRLPRSRRYNCMLKHLRSAYVIGLTSTGAAARRNKVEIGEETGQKNEGILEKVGSPIVIIEEAAQLLESHVIASMTKKCQHLIMLGDHQQLKPFVTTQHLATEYSLNISLFEKLVVNEVVKKISLTHQHRMRPEIASLLRPHIYKHLIDAPSTQKKTNICELSKNVFFLNHNEPERKSPNKKGFWNPYEIDMLLKLAKILVITRYLPTEITIISMYNEQRIRLIEARDKIPCLVNVEITSVDGFQGKENEIILLSLVRNNNEGHIGFLSEVNRICVALSRSRSGLYIMGNMQCLTKHSEMWRKVGKHLKTLEAIGPTLNLTCTKHKVSQPLSIRGDWICCPSCFATRKKRQKKRRRRRWRRLNRNNDI